MPKWIRVAVATGVLAAVIVGLTPGEGQAQATYPPPTPIPLICAQVIGGIRIDDGRVVVRFRARLRFGGGPGCADTTVDISGESVRVFLVRAFANRDGSYLSDELTLPSELDPGPHDIIFDIAGRGEVVRPILVITEEAAASPRQIAGAGTTRTPTGGVTPGKLPFTGGNVLVLVLWALALIGFGTALLVAARRRIGWLSPVKIRGLGRRGYSARSRALPPPSVAHIDTSGFVPVRPGVGHPLGAQSIDTNPARVFSEADIDPRTAK